jgi:hypothetical protein
MRDAFVTDDMLTVACRLLENEWPREDDFDACPVCPLLHCASALFEGPHSGHLPSVFPFRRLAAFAASDWDELAALSFGVFEVLTRRCPELLPVLTGSGLREALTAGAERSFDVKRELARVAANLMGLEGGEALAGFLRSAVVASVLEAVPQFDAALAKAILRAVAAAVTKVSAHSAEVRAVLGVRAQEMVEECDFGEDEEAAELIERVRTLLID